MDGEISRIGYFKPTTFLIAHLANQTFLSFYFQEPKPKAELYRLPVIITRIPRKRMKFVDRNKRDDTF